MTTVTLQMRPQPYHGPSENLEAEANSDRAGCARMLQNSIPTKSGSGKKAALPATGNQGRPSRKKQSGGVQQKLVSPGIGPLPKPPRRRRTQPGKARLDEEQSLNELRWQLPYIILKFLRTKWQASGKSADPKSVQELLRTARIYAERPTLFGWNSPRQLSNPSTIRQLFERTRPSFLKEPLDAGDLGSWLSVILLSLEPSGGGWQIALDEVERRLFPPPKPPKPARGKRRRPLKPYEKRLADWVRRYWEPAKPQR